MGLKHGNNSARAVIWPLEWKEYINMHNFNNTQEQSDNFKKLADLNNLAEDWRQQTNFHSAHRLSQNLIRSPG